MESLHQELIGKRILLTGGAGFTGSEMVHTLMKRYSHFPNFCLVMVDKMSYNSCLESFSEYMQRKYHGLFTFVQSDICDTDVMCSLMKDNKIDMVMNFAAETHVDHSFKCSMKFTQANVLGTHSLLEAARVYGKLTKFQHVSTDEVYGPSALGDNVLKHEDYSILSPTNPYSATKAAAEHICWSYFHSYKIPVVMTRGSNIYGQRQFPDKVIPKFIEQLNHGKKLTIHDNHRSGEMERSFIHVEDVCSAQEIILAKGKIGQIYNITDGFEITISELAKKLVKLYGHENPEEHITFVEGRKFNDVRYAISNDKLLSLGWKPSVNFEDGLQRTIQWYKDHPNYWPKNLTIAALGTEFVPELV